MRQKQKLPPFWTAKYRLKHGPRWSLPVFATVLSIYAMLRGVDLAVDPEVSNELFAYANIIGTHTWGAAQALTAFCVIVALAGRWIAGIIVSAVAAAVVWLMYAVVLLQGLWPTIEQQGGLRNVFVPMNTASLFVVVFFLAMYQYKRTVIEDSEDD